LFYAYIGRERPKVKNSKGIPQFIAALRIALTALFGAYLLGLVLYLGLRFVLGGRFWWLALLNDFAVVLFLPLPVVLVLGGLFRLRWVFGIGLCLTLVGGLWFGPYYVPQDNVVPSGPTLRVVTFNVWGHNAHLEEVQAWLREVEADVVLMQEVPERYANNGVSELDDLYPYQIGQPTSERWWGNLLLSHYPILSVERLPGDGVPAQQRFVIDFDGQVVAVYNVHLAMPIGSGSRFPQLRKGFVLDVALSYDDSARNAEIRRLLERLETEPYPFIVAGDFNMSEQAVIYGEVTGRMEDAFRETGVGWGGSWPISIVDELPEFLPALLRMDYIWHSAHFRSIEAHRGPKLGSDHLPFYTVLDLQTE
jgi:endonuclease/exonuclease/phosphatase family metal-dependent hydrolase